MNDDIGSEFRMTGTINVLELLNKHTNITVIPMLITDSSSIIIEQAPHLKKLEQFFVKPHLDGDCAFVDNFPH